MVGGSVTVSVENKPSIEMYILHKKRKNKNLLIVIIVAVVLTIIGYQFIDLLHNSETEIHTEHRNRFEELKNKLVNKEQLTEAEWDEVCNLLPLKEIQVNACDSCHDYLRALVGGKHEKHLSNYLNKTEKELLKGIRSYQKQIDLHLDKIANPIKHIHNWNNLHPDHRKNLQNEKWNEDIKRLKEQKQILECILKNR